MRIFAGLVLLSLTHACASAAGGQTGEEQRRGDAGSGGAGPISSIVADFVESEEGFYLAWGEEPSNLATYDNGVAPTLIWEGTEGDPAPGALKVAALYASEGQFVDVRKEMPYPFAASHWSGMRTLTARIKVQEGFSLDPSSVGTATLYATSVPDGYVHASATVELAATSSWQTVTCALDVASFDPASISALGVRLRLASLGTAASPGLYPAVVLLDSFTLDGP